MLITFIGFDSHGPFRRNYTDTAGGPGGRSGEGVRWESQGEAVSARGFKT